MFPQQALTEDHFQGLGRIVSETPESLHVLMNGLRAASCGGAYYVHPTDTGAFETVEDAIAQGEADNPLGDGEIVIMLASGFLHSLPVAGLVIDTDNHYCFVSMTPDFYSTSGRTRLDGNLELKATTGSVFKHVCFHGITVQDMELTVRERRRVIFNNALMYDVDFKLEHGTDGFDIFLKDCRYNGQMVIDSLDLPATPTSTFHVVGGYILTMDFSADYAKIGAIKTLTFERTHLFFMTLGTNYVFDLQLTDKQITFDSCSFETSPSTPLRLFKNPSASFLLKWQGMNLFQNSDVIGSTLMVVDFAGPTAVQHAPWVDTGALPTNPCAGTMVLDTSDIGSTWKWLTWNGSAWV